VRWCNNLHIPLEACTKNAADYASDVYFLAEARDERARPLLRQALTSPNNGVVISALRGLAWLKDNDAITLIEENLQRFAPKLAQRIASATVDFDDPRVQPLIQKYVRDPALLQELEEAISKRKSAQQH
jgi:HEAT repeat protein